MIRKVVLTCLGAVALLIGVTLSALAPPPAAAASLVQVTNFGANPSNLQMHFTLPSGQTITSGWNLTYSPPSGQVTAGNVGHNALIGSGGSVSGIGFQATHTGNTGEPTSFTLNGNPCAIG